MLHADNLILPETFLSVLRQRVLIRMDCDGLVSCSLVVRTLRYCVLSLIQALERRLFRSSFTTVIRLAVSALLAAQQHISRPQTNVSRPISLMRLSKVQLSTPCRCVTMPSK